VQRTKYELIQVQKIGGSSRMIPRSPTKMKENAKAIEVAPAAIGNHLSLVRPRCDRAISHANAPRHAAIAVNSSDTGRKLNGPLISGEKMIAP
jgi:hypothetical protein